MIFSISNRYKATHRLLLLGTNCFFSYFLMFYLVKIVSYTAYACIMYKSLTWKHSYCKEDWSWLSRYMLFKYKQQWNYYWMRRIISRPLCLFLTAKFSAKFSSQLVFRIFCRCFPKNSSNGRQMAMVAEVKYMLSLVIKIQLDN